MALKDNWVNKVDEVDDVLAEDINNIASAVIDLENKEVVVPVTSVNGKTGEVEISKSDVGLGNVDNTSDLDKPISTLTQQALNGKLDIAIGYEDEIDTYVGESVKTYLIVDSTRDIPEEEQGRFDQYYLIFIPQRYNWLGLLADIQYKIDSYGMSVRKASYLSSDGYSWSEWQSFEMTTNKVTAIDGNATNAQYPSAKAVWDAIKNNAEIEVVTITDMAEGTASHTYKQMKEAHEKGKLILLYIPELQIIAITTWYLDKDDTEIISAKFQYKNLHYEAYTRGDYGDTWEFPRDNLIVDNLKSTSVEKALSANQGRVLNEKIGDIETALDSIIEIQNELMGVSE